jgi:prefoldin subunit 5
MAITKEDLDSAVGELKELITKRADGLDKEIKSVHSDLAQHDERANTMMGELQQALQLERRITRLEQKVGL